MNSVTSPGKNSTVFMTPEMAAEILESCNHRNRRVSNELVNRISRDIKNDRWIYNGQPIIFDDEGQLIDGQHRLFAIAKSGKTVETLLVSGIQDKKAFHTIDHGKPRSLSCNLSADKVSNSTTVASVARMFYSIYRCNDLSKFKLYTHAFSNLELYEFLEEVPCIHEAAKMAGQTRTFCTSSVMGTALTVFMILDEVSARKFHYLLTEEEYPYRDHPIKKLRSKLMQVKMVTGKKLNRLETLALIFKTWNYWHKGKTVKTLSWNASSTFPIPLGWG